MKKLNNEKAYNSNINCGRQNTIFKLSLKNYKQALAHLLSISDNLVFADGVICAVHNGLYAFGMIEDNSVKIAEPLVLDCSLLKDVIKSKEIATITFNIEGRKAETTEPYKFSVPLREIEDKTLIDECEKRFTVLKELEGAIKELPSEEFTFVDKKNDRECNAVWFKIKNGLILDMLKRVKAGKASDVEIEIGNSLLIKNNATGARATYDRISASDKISIVTLEDCQPALESAFISKENEEEAEKDQSKVIIVDGCFLIVMNKASTIISSTVDRPLGGA